MKKALVLGAGGFIGSHLVKRLKEENEILRTRVEESKDLIQDARQSIDNAKDNLFKQTSHIILFSL